MTTSGSGDLGEGAGTEQPPSAGPPSGSGTVPPYALRFSVDYPDRELDKLSSALRIFWVIPIAIVLGGVASYSFSWQFSPGAWITLATGGAGLIFLAPMLMIVFRQKYPRWWWDFNVELLKFQARVNMYAALTTDVYPATDEEQSVHLEADYPNVEKDLNRWLPLVKWLLALPHYIVLFFLYIAVFFVLIYVWIKILIDGRYPKDAFEFVVGVSRWSYRVEAYALLLNTDVYPPFSLE